MLVKNNFFIFKCLFFLLISIFSYVTLCDEYCDVKVGFSPGSSAMNMILNALRKTDHSIEIAAYSFTSKDIVREILEASKRGVVIRIVADKKSNIGKNSILRSLSKIPKVDVRLNDSYSIMHNKFMILDGKILETGSFNYSNNAYKRNAENIVIIKNCKEIIEKYRNEFSRLWSQSNNYFN